MLAPRTRTGDPPAPETERLVLRPLAPNDLCSVHRIFADPAVRRHLFDGEPVNVETTRSLLERSERDFAGGGVGLFGIRVRGEDGLVGFCGFFVVEGVGEPEMTYGLMPAVWGRGYATEAARSVARHALDGAGFPRVLVGTERANTASMRVIERLGARPLGEAAPAFPEVVYFELGRGAGEKNERDGAGRAVPTTGRR